MNDNSHGVVRDMFDVSQVVWDVEFYGDIHLYIFLRSGQSQDQKCEILKLRDSFKTGISCPVLCQDSNNAIHFNVRHQ